MDTIFALATARGKAGVAVVRISGPKSEGVLRGMAGELPEPRRAVVRELKTRDGSILDQALVIRFEEGKSFTGEAVVELHLHGSVAVINAVMREVGGYEEVRVAEPGEFTRRALENECLDLTQVEGLADLIDAETEVQRKQALRVLSGALGEKADTWRRQLIRAAALLEATIDFVDEDVPIDVSPEVMDLIDAVTVSMSTELAGANASERIRDGFEVAIVGAPNAGKSTLLNAFAGREAAITSEIAGTTRDVIEVRMDLAGLPVTILDTAGLRETSDKVEEIGVRRAIERAQAADLRIFLTTGDSDYQGLQPDTIDLVVVGKSDLGNSGDVSVSGKTGEGVPELIGEIARRLTSIVGGSGVIIRERHRIGIERALQSMETARVEVEFGAERTELAAEELRSAVRSVEAIVGKVDVENLLDEIFQSFCIGK